MMQRLVISSAILISYKNYNQKINRLNYFCICYVCQIIVFLYSVSYIKK
ncbi:hypothetical protein XCR1_1890007 [Xenorhabdus cabanillasii JM26]|uniref:Uncharacterized protein n=1 Tax=Xenorhabdus cabanillasii JM26 TaxID=1427517 RepID=W1J0K7_9GAMM|nr:hypothetical protein XCR1_1890007 [Xenorhabdus cabanillasii JM26]